MNDKLNWLLIVLYSYCNIQIVLDYMLSYSGCSFLLQKRPFFRGSEDADASNASTWSCSAVTENKDNQCAAAESADREYRQASGSTL